MGDKVTVTSITSLDNSSAVNSINNTVETLADEFDKVLYRDGSLDVTGNINMNSKRLLNVGAPVSLSDGARLKDIADLESVGVIELPVDYLPDGTSAVSRTLPVKTKDWGFTPLDFGAAADGVTDDTTAIQNTINACVLYRRPFRGAGRTYVSGSVTIPTSNGLKMDWEGARINITGDMSGATDDTNRTALFMFEGSGTIENFVLCNFEAVGDGNTAHKHRVIGYTYASPPTLKNIFVHNFQIESIMIGGIFPGVQGLSVTNFRVKNSFGEVSGQGLGFATEMASGVRPVNVRFQNGEIDGTTRHGIYINHCDGATINNVMFLNHRATLFSSSTGATGKAACIFSRSSGGTLSNLKFKGCRDVGLGIDQDSTYTCEDVSVTNVVFFPVQGTSINIGRTNGAGECRNVTLKNIVLHTSNAWADPEVSITDVQNLTIDGVVVKADVGYASSHILFKISEYDASYFKNILIQNVRGQISGSGSNYTVSLSTALAASSGGLIELLNNKVAGVSKEYLYGTVGACSNSNVRSDWTYQQDITTAGAPSVAGYNRFNIQLTSAGNITDFTNSYDGQLIELFFSNSNATLKNTNFYLSGGVDFVGSAADKMNMRREALAGTGKFVECNRSVNA